MRVFLHIIIFALMAAPEAVLAQQTVSRAVEPEKNPEYVELLRYETRLRVREDSILQATDRTREQFRLDPGNRQQYGAELLQLEREVLDVRSRLDNVRGRIGRIEQEWVVSSLNRQSDYTKTVPPVAGDSVRRDSATIRRADAPKADSPFLLNNRAFTERLKPTDLRAMRDAQSRERSVVDLVSAYRANYRHISQLNEAYLNAESAPEADSIHAQYEKAAALNAQIADSVEIIWTYIWDNKTYGCSYLADYMNWSEQLSTFDRRVQQLRMREAENKGRFMHDAVAFYPLEKELLLDYEIELAGMLGLSAARDSLVDAKRYVDPREFEFAAIAFSPRYFFDYDSVEIRKQSAYSTRNPIPETQVFPGGTIYRVVLGTFAKAQPVTVFRTVWPLSFQRLEDGRYRYFAGGYRTQEEAESAVATLKRVGFRRPEVVVWQEGVYRNLTEEPAAGSAGSSATKHAAGSEFYRIEISGGGSDLSPQVKSTISTLAPGKDLARVAIPARDGDPASYIFLLGSFDSRTAAEQIANAIGNQSPTLSAKVVELK